MASTPQPILDRPPISADAAVGASAMRKATRRLIPLIALGYGAAYMDRVNISFASLQMNRDLHFSATVYGFGAGLFFLSYAACEIPSNLLLYRFGARRWLSRIMVTWGILAIAMLLVRTPWQFYTARFFLGLAEAGFFPGVIFYLTQWFPQELRARAISRFYISLPLSSVVTGLIAGPLLNLDGHLGLRGWQWLFLVEGIPPILLGIAFLYLLPDCPQQAKWLTEDERAWIIHHVHNDPSLSGQRSHDLSAALLDPRVWQLGLFMLLMLASSYAYTFVAPDVIQRATHLSTSKVGYLIATLSLLGAAAMLINGIYSDRIQRRTPHSNYPRYMHIIPWAFLISAGFFACGLSTNPINVVTAIGAIIIAYNAMQGPLWSLPGSFFQGRSAAAGIATLNMIGMIGGFLGPYFVGFAKDLTGDYQRGLLFMSLPMLLGAAIMFYLRAETRLRSTALRTENPVPSS
ncbi:MFS transporter [Tunturiibacter gelidoferens]|uniref:ACS family tartrate transporter-like MFS transporter n=1 Tax=Tunturiibacter lichenicola TaxID=2051959 RepID=A0A7Y9NL96_9BACT|nr:MFS transporter [Edaphobacter lichenicola]NYF51242.1 ACS family tartrate transporter-like MFS transporter [Edaphobacter lichenicola]